MRRAVLIPFLILLPACSQSDDVARVVSRAVFAAGASAPREAPAVEDSAQPASGQAEELAQWNFSEDEGGAWINYAIPDSDDAGPALTCTRQSGTVSASLWVEHREDERVGAPPVKTKLTLKSDAVAGAYDAVAQGEEMYGGMQVSADIPATAPVLAAFARTGSIELAAYGESSRPPPAPTETVRRFIAACARP